MSEKSEKDVVEATVEEVKVTEVIEPVVEKAEVPTIGNLDTGAIASGTTKVKKTETKAEPKVDAPRDVKVALFSERNIYADGFGKINVGYNIVPRKYSEFWLKQRGVRLATPAEVAEVFG
jgi:hypothetical protein